MTEPDVSLSKQALLTQRAYALPLERRSLHKKGPVKQEGLLTQWHVAAYWTEQALAVVAHNTLS